MSQFNIPTLEPCDFDAHYLWIAGEMKILRLTAEKGTEDSFYVNPYYDLDLGEEGILMGAIEDGFVVYETDKVTLLYKE